MYNGVDTLCECIVLIEIKQGISIKSIDIISLLNKESYKKKVLRSGGYNFFRLCYIYYPRPGVNKETYMR